MLLRAGRPLKYVVTYISENYKEHPPPPNSHFAYNYKSTLITTLLEISPVHSKQMSCIAIILGTCIVNFTPFESDIICSFNRPERNGYDHSVEVILERLGYEVMHIQGS